MLQHNNSAERALIDGASPARIIENIYSGNVCIELPAQKKEIKKSSNDIIKINEDDAKIVVLRSGSKIVVNTCNSVAPKS